MLIYKLQPLCTLSVMISSQLEAQGMPCIEFAPDQYHKMFNSRFHSQTNVLESLANSARRWRRRKINCNSNNQDESGIGWCNYQLSTTNAVQCSTFE